LTDHYMQIIANRAPIGFEAEFVNQRSENICYRGILMPFSSDGDAIDFIYGVINWKAVGAHAEAEADTEAAVAADVPVEILADVPELVLELVPELVPEEEIAPDCEEPVVAAID